MRKTELKNVIENFNLSKFSKRNFVSLIKNNLDSEHNELNSIINSMLENNFIIEESFFKKNDFNGILADNYEKDVNLYTIRKDRYLFKVYVACGDYNGISYDVFCEDKCLAEISQLFDTEKYEFYKKLLYYTLDDLSNKKLNSDGLGLDVWKYINDEVYELDKDDLALLSSIDSTIIYSNYIPFATTLGYEAQFFNRYCEDNNYVSFDVYKINENEAKELIDSHVVEDFHSIVEILSFINKDFNNIISDL